MALRVGRGSAAAMALAGALLLSSPPAGAFEILAMLVRAIPATAAGEPVAPAFDFAVPRVQADWPAISWQAVGVDDINRALIDRDRGIATVGIAFPDLDGMLRYGTPPDTRLLLYGSAIARDAVRPALMARPGMIEGTYNSFATFSVGADYAVDPAAMENGFPFGGGWRAYRAAIRNGFAAVAFATPALESAMAGIEAQDRGGIPDGPVVEMIDAAARIVPDELDAYAATGIPGTALREGQFFGARYVLVIASAGSDWEATQFVLLFEDEEAASAGAASLAAALEALRAWPDGAKVLTKATGLPDGAMASVTVLFEPRTPDHPSSALLNRWRNDLFSGGVRLAPPGGP